MKEQIRVLILEDEVELLDLLARNLSTKYHVDKATNLSDAKTLIDSNRYDVFLVDLYLPDGNGLDLITHLWKKNGKLDSITIVISAETDVDVKISGFNMGVDDYITKPFHKEELFARIESKLKSRSEASNCIQKGGLLIDFKTYQSFATSSGEKKKLNLTLLETRLLVCFFEREKDILTRDDLKDAVWGKDVNITERTIDATISSLKKKLPKTIDIKSQYGKGYRLLVL